MVVEKKIHWECISVKCQSIYALGDVCWLSRDYKLSPAIPGLHSNDWFHFFDLGHSSASWPQIVDHINSEVNYTWLKTVANLLGMGCHNCRDYDRDRAKAKVRDSRFQAMRG